jgi:hypothetical protein
LKRILIQTAGVAAAVAIFVVLTIQPRRLLLGAATDGTVSGVIHVHTNRSDGSRSPDEIAAAARQAGLQFIVFTDHGDGTRRLDPPAYRSGVLCLDGVEVSTSGGHYIALDMPPAPYPLGGEGRDVVEDVRRLGGFGIVAHPDSPKPELAWRDWNAPFDAIEMVNPDTGWRVVAQQPGWRPRLRLLSALIDYSFRPAETITSLVHQDETLATRWAAVASERRVITLAGADAHARLALRSADPGDSTFALPLPGYEPSFRVLSVRVRPDGAFSGSAFEDGKTLLRGLRAGRLHSVIDGIATPGSLELLASQGTEQASEGDELTAHGPITLRIRTNAPPAFTTTVWNGTTIVSGNRHEQEFAVDIPGGAPGVYWVDVRSTERTRNLVWLRSNAIYVRGGRAERPGIATPSPAAGAGRAIFDGTSGEGWAVEHDPSSLAALDLAPAVGGNELRLRFGLSTQITPAPAVALTYGTPGGLTGYTRLSFTARAEGPMRISVQLRVPRDGREWDRWQRSVFVGESAQERILDLSDFRPAGPQLPGAAPLDAVRTLMFVIDPVNTKRGTSSRFWISRATLLR